MIVTIPELGYQLRPYSKGPCWQLFELATDCKGSDGEPLPDKWKPCDYYPSTLAHGLSVVLERAARRSPVHSELKAAVAEVRRIALTINAASKRLQEVE